MAFCDFAVRYDPKEDTQDDLLDRILYAVFIKRIKANKPVTAFIGGSSGTGKSLTSLALMIKFLHLQNIEIQDFLNDINVYTPIEYPTKIDKLLFDKKLKPINVLTIHEAREVVKAKMWQSFLTQAISDVSAMSRSVKRIILLIVSQFIRDITADIRYTLDYYMIVKRPIGQKARLYINVMWKDDRDLEKPKLRKRKLQGYIISPSGRYQRYIPQYFEITMPPKEIVESFENQDRISKTMIIRNKLDKLLREMKKEVVIESDKVDKIIEFYSKHPNQISLIGTKRGDKLKLNKDFKIMHDLTSLELELFETKLKDKLISQGLMKKQELQNADEEIDI